MNEICRNDPPAATAAATTLAEAVESTVALVAEVDETLAAPASETTTAAAMQELDRRIRELEAAIGDLRSVGSAAPVSAAAAPVTSGRKTQESCAPRLMGKGADAPAAGAVNDALRSLSLEQRLAVKAGLLRAGLL